MKRARIIVLLIAVAAGGVAAKLASMREVSAPPPAPPPVAQVETVDVLIASKDIGLGQALSTQNISWQTWPTATAAGFIKKETRPNAIKDLSGSRARTGFAAGEPIQESRLVKAGNGFLATILPKGMRAVATAITPENGAGGFILPGDHVDVLLTRTPIGAKGEEGSITDTILRNVQVLAIDHDLEEKNSQSTATGKIATLSLTPRQAETIVLARRLGTISLALRSIDDVAGTGDEETTSLGQRGRINTVRYGVTTTIPR